VIGRHVKSTGGKGPSNRNSKKIMRRRKRTRMRKATKVRGGRNKGSRAWRESVYGEKHP